MGKSQKDGISWSWQTVGVPKFCEDSPDCTPARLQGKSLLASPKGNGSFPEEGVMETSPAGEKQPPQVASADASARRASGSPDSTSDLPAPTAEQTSSAGTDPSKQPLCQEPPSGPAILCPCPDHSEKRLCADAPQVVVPSKRDRWMIGGLLLGFLLGAAAVLWVLGHQLARLPRLEGQELREAIGRLQWWAAGIAWLGAMGFLGAAWWLFRLGWKINRTGRYPPPGMQVLWTTRIRTGPPALVRANLVLVGAVVLAAVGTLGIIWLYQQAIEALRNLLPGR